MNRWLGQVLSRLAFPNYLISRTATNGRAFPARWYHLMILSIWRYFKTKTHADSCWECDFTVFRAKSQSGSNSKSRSRMNDGADEIPPYRSSMNVPGDIAQLSYKELQALASRYRVPGNVKVSCHFRRDAAVDADRPSLCPFLNFIARRRFSVPSGDKLIEISRPV